MQSRLECSLIDGLDNSSVEMIVVSLDIYCGAQKTIAQSMLSVTIMTTFVNFIVILYIEPSLKNKQFMNCVKEKNHDGT